ncbi:MAG: hypothetical protein HZB39_09595 [Planctomycetes bacterium]|nr:hypothetical protein [Planctomycetota bacterium]
MVWTGWLRGGLEILALLFWSQMFAAVAFLAFVLSHREWRRSPAFWSLGAYGVVSVLGWMGLKAWPPWSAWFLVALLAFPATTLVRLARRR